MGVKQKNQCVCVYPFTREGGNTPCGGAGTPNGASIHIFSYDFFEFELKPTGKDSADPTQQEFQHHIV